MKKMLMIIAICALMGCSVNGGVNASGGSNGVGLGIGLGTGIRF